MEKPFEVKVVKALNFTSRVIGVRDYRQIEFGKKEFVGIRLQNGKNVHIPTDSSPVISDMAKAVLFANEAEGLKAVVAEIARFVKTQGQMAVMICDAQDTFRLLAVDENLGKPGFSGRGREISYQDAFTF